MHAVAMDDELRAAMTIFDRCVVERDAAGADAVLDDDYALVLVHPAPAKMERARWLAVLPEYLVHRYEVEDQVIEVDGDVASVLQRVAMDATVLGEDRSGRFIISDTWRQRDGRWRIWRRHSTPLLAGRLPGAGSQPDPTVPVTATPTTPLPATKAADDSNDERSVLLGYLDYHRAVLARKAEGLTDEQARRAACPPSALTLLGLIRHMTDVERMWFRNSLRDEGVGYRYTVSDEDESDLFPPADATIADALVQYWDEIATANAILAEASVDDPTRGEPQPGHSLRRTVVHMIEEYARHCGHADLLREAIDGQTGD